MTVVLVAAAVAATIALSFSWTTRWSREDAARDARYQAKLAADSITTSLDTLSTSLSALASSPLAVAKVRNPTQCSLTANGLRDYPGAHFDLWAPDGSMLCSSAGSADSEADAGVVTPAWLPRALGSATPVIARTTRDPVTGRAAITMAARVIDDQRAVAAIAAVVPVARVGDVLERSYAGPDHFTFTVVEPAAHVVRSVSGVDRAADTPLDPATFGSRAHGTWRALDGRDRLFGSAPVATLGWRVYAGVDASHVTATARDAAGRQLLLAVVALIALSAVAIFVQRKILRPLRSVTHTIVATRDAPMPAPVPVRGPREIATLATEFNAMIEARLEYEAQLTERALHDDLTRLPNRALLRDRLSRAVQTNAPGRSVGVLFLDLDRFKLVNDSLGHPAGDALLQGVAARLHGAVRPEDTLARFGGDEFVVVCSDLDGPADAVDVARRLATALDAPFAVADSEVNVSATIGIALAPDTTADPDELVRGADIAMYHAKESNRPWDLWDEDLRARSAHRLELQQDLRRAIAARQLSVAYQPVWDVEEWQIIGVEALARWNHPVLGPVPPPQFIPLAEESGLIGAIGEFVLAEASRFVGTLNQAGHRLSIAVNVTVAQLDDSLPSMLARHLERSKLDPDLLCLELTESSLCDALGSSADTLTRIRAMGVHTAVDDFGTGYSSLSYLQHFPFDTLKIDRSFIEPLGREPGRAGALVDAIARMARALGLHVVAEGVETPEQLAVVRELGCRYVQGFLLSTPLAPEELRSQLEESRRPTLDRNSVRSAATPAG
jgi:diguanylate cyclase (GGDEF)-like protein